MNSSIPLVSVGIPTYNRRHFLPQTLDSIFNQSFKDYEVVIVDDGSTDQTSEWIASLNDSRIRYYYQPNAGDAAARNRIIQLAQGQYITFLDSDDLMAENALQNMVQTIQQYHQPVIVYGAYWRIDETGRIIGRYKGPMPSGQVTSHLFDRIFIHSCGSMFPKTVFDEHGLCFDTSLKVCSDYYLWLRLSTRYPFIPTSHPTFLRRRHAGCLSQISSEKVKIELSVLKKFYEQEGQEFIDPARASKRFSRCLYRIAKALRQEKQMALAKDYFYDSFKTKPNLKALLGYLCIYLKS